MLIAIMPNGSVQMIYSDEMRELLNEGSGSIQRASHVEPEIDNTWSADMSPIGGEILSGFETRESALKAEVEYIEQNLLRAPKCKYCGQFDSDSHWKDCIPF